MRNMSSLNVLMLLAGISAYPILYGMNDSNVYKQNRNSRVDPSSILGKHIVGYKGWYNCDDKKEATYHWYSSKVLTDVLPDVSEYNPEDLCTLPGLKHKNGDPVKVFSSYNPGVVDLHFKWMQEYNIDGIFLTHFFADLEKKVLRQKRINITQNVKNSAEKYGRTWALMFDISGHSKDVKSKLSKYLEYFRGMIAESDMYLHSNGKPMIAIWGIGGETENHIADPAQALEIINYLKQEGFSVFGGLISSDLAFMKTFDEKWNTVFQSLDMISPGVMYGDIEKSKKTIAEGIAHSNDFGALYVPVLHPGRSAENLLGTGLNSFPRNNGSFYSALGEAAIAVGARTLFTAMFDEVNEGTAIFKTIAKKENLPASGAFISLDFDGYEASSDKYLRLAGSITQKLKNKPSIKKTVKDSTQIRISVQEAQISSQPILSNLRVDPSTMLGKHMVGYQGWYNCDDKKEATYHWYSSKVLTDVLPDVSEYNPEDLCTLPGLKHNNGDPVKVFSSYNPGVVDLHFKWMQEYNIDGVFLQQFFSDLEKKELSKKRIEITESVKNSAEKYGRTGALMFDISGHSKDVKSKLSKYLEYFRGMIAESDMYLHSNGKPMIAIWGIGGDTDNHIVNASVALDVVNFLKHEGFSIYAGVLRSDFYKDGAKDEKWNEVYRQMDVISPWHIKGDTKGDQFIEAKKAAELGNSVLNGTDTIYVPVIYPGKSGKNLRDLGLNWKPREGGKLYSDLGEGAIAGGAKALYTAMFDEVNEGTAIYKTVAKKEDLPSEGEYISLDVDGHEMGSDKYLVIAGDLKKKLQGNL